MGAPGDGIAIVLVTKTPERAAAIATSLERADDRLVAEPTADTDAALRVLRDTPVDCLVTAGGLTDPTGVPFVETVRDRHPELPIVFCPDEALDAAAVSDAFEAGATDVARSCGESDRTPVLVRRISNAVASARAVAEAERQRRRLEAFTSGVSHDLRNPLTVAQGRIELARREGDVGHVDDAAAAIDRTFELIDDLLTLAKQGERPRELDSVELSDLAERCWANVATGDATLVVDGDRRLLAHPSRLKQLLENLFRNAVDHGGDDVTVFVGDISPMYTTTRAETDLPTGFFVEDDGRGISQDECEDVFDVGYTTAEGGTGFGLNIVREVANAHGWEVSVSEGTRGGARFEITGAESGG
ncbi:HAMP domain-containing sensor histidine kinase [Halorubrum sp. Eb13]|uniref:receiver/sensor box histidine kinase n=1 Tax=Halorubrum sp. Eb13 TaxID=1383843 RepID=UPI000B98E3C6|nr:HAMP domain-containing sensor histidine kinase [Halorubrum sp. Eb13]OYR45776.1 sensor histidine kinase [Halorubrum sp. Eb13]